jgi:hypothetical protein
MWRQPTRVIGAKLGLQDSTNFKSYERCLSEVRSLGMALLAIDTKDPVCSKTLGLLLCLVRLHFAFTRRLQE